MSVQLIWYIYHQGSWWSIVLTSICLLSWYWKYFRGIRFVNSNFSLQWFYPSTEFSNEAACSLSGELDAFSFTKEDDNTSGHFPADSFETDLESGCEPLAGRKILFRDHTTLDRKMVSV